MKTCLPIVLLSVLASTVQAQDTPFVRIDRLQRLAALADKIPPKQFDMNEWGTRGDPDDPNYVGCLAGWSTKEFSGDGLTYNNRTEVSFGDQINMGAAAKFFGLDYRTTLYLFSPLGGGYPDQSKDRFDPRRAAANVREVIARARKGAA